MAWPPFKVLLGYFELTVQGQYVQSNDHMYTHAQMASPLSAVQLAAQEMSLFTIATGLLYSLAQAFPEVHLSGGSRSSQVEDQH